MRQVFRMRPWILPQEPAPLVSIFKKFGRIETFPKGSFFEHGGLGSSAQIGLLLEGLVTFSFIDMQSQLHIFSLITPGRTIGDLDAINPHQVNVLAECIRPSRIVIVRRSDFIGALRQSVDLMQLYADMSILKEESCLEGMAANFTLNLDARLKVLLLSILDSIGEVDRHGWNPCPLNLTITEMSQIISANRSWLSTHLSELIKEGLAKKEGRKLFFHGELFKNVYDWGRGAGRRPDLLQSEPDPAKRLTSDF